MIGDVKTKLQCYPLQDLLDKNYHAAKQLSPEQRRGRFCATITGPFAHFNEGARGSEKPTSPIPSPGALCGTLSADFWHPGFLYEVKEIAVMNRIVAINVTKNELESIPTVGHVERLRKREAMGEVQDLTLKAGAARQQRTLGLLCDVKYIVTVEIKKSKEKGEQFDLLKSAYELKRHLVKGARFTPYLGIKECTADVRLCTMEDLMESSAYAGKRIDFGRRPFQCDYRGAEKQWYQYHPIMIDGLIKVPTEKEVMGDAAYTV